ncbi:HNH endonuclease [Rhodococcus rhodochrous]|uniref:HNH endonuclease n=1 Tax=Rhodococcus rhodochrous TaxID=1829 RepID=UPI0038510959
MVMSSLSFLRRRWIMMIQDGAVINCGICGEPVPAKAKGSNRICKGGKGTITVDHIFPKSWGGSNDLSNLQPAHLLCNQQKGNRLGKHSQGGR